MPGMELGLLLTTGLLVYNYILRSECHEELRTSGKPSNEPEPMEFCSSWSFQGSLRHRGLRREWKRVLTKGKKEAMVKYVWKKQGRLQVVLPFLGWEA